LGKGKLIQPPQQDQAVAQQTPMSPKELRKAAVKAIPPDQLAAAADDQDKLEAMIKAKMDELQAQNLAQAAQQRAGSASTYTLAHLTGTGRLRLTDEQRKELVDFVQQGGTVVFDAAGGDTTFSDSLQRELLKAFGDSAKEALDTPLPPDAPLYTANGKMDEFTYRRWTRGKITGSLKSPRVRGITVNGRLAVFLSAEDLTEGMVGQTVDGIIGYSPATATEIMRHIVLYAANPAPATN
jgi:hypothetical protein